ncbi:MAG: single-stranded DNA-binding protein [Candidatus Sedimenticola sp. 6PFRAG7]
MSGVSKHNQRPYSFNKQEAWAHLPGQPYPSRMELTLDEGSSAYKQGNYTIQPESLYVDRFGKLALGTLKLKPMTASKAA